VTDCHAEGPVAACEAGDPISAVTWMVLLILTPELDDADADDALLALLMAREAKGEIATLDVVDLPLQEGVAADCDAHGGVSKVSTYCCRVILMRTSSSRPEELAPRRSRGE